MKPAKIAPLNNVYALRKADKNRNEIISYIRTMSSGTVAQIIGSSKYVDIDNAVMKTLGRISKMDIVEFCLMKADLDTVTKLFREAMEDK